MGGEDADAARGCAREDGVDVGVGRQRHGDVQPGRRAADLVVGQVLAEGRHEPVAPAAVAQAHPAQVAIELAALDERGQRELVERRRAAVGPAALVGDRAGEGAGQDHPAQAQRGRERLARGAEVGDAPRAEALQRAQRLAVVAVLAVVVVLDHEGVVRGRPSRAAPRGARGRGRRRWGTGAPG